jgi:GTP-binding protein YchF
MEVGLVGFSGVGKTTIFSALTGIRAPVGFHQGQSEKVNLGVIKVPDSRLDTLAEFYGSRKVAPAEVRFVDLPGRGGGARNALDPGLIAQMRDVDAFALVVRGFEDAAGAQPAPVREFRAFLDELVLADLAVVEKRLERLKKEKASEQELRLLKKCHEALDGGRQLRHMGLRPDEENALAHFAFVSLKPILIVLNVAEADIEKPLPSEFKETAEAEQSVAMAVCGQVEMEVEELPEEERGEYLGALGIAEPARQRFIQASYELLTLISFITHNAQEVRAWPIRRGTSAVQAAGKVHTDMERGFIRAEVIHFDDLMACGSEAKCRETGKLRVEGRDYVVQDGDIVHFRFNV